MKEFVTANGRTFECTGVTTGINSITLTMEKQETDELKRFFRGVEELTVSFEGAEKPHGIYTEPDYSLEYEEITEHADGSVSVRMHIKDKTEMRLDRLEKSQEIQDAAIEELGKISGGEA